MFRRLCPKAVSILSLFPCPLLLHRVLLFLPLLKFAATRRDGYISSILLFTRKIYNCLS